MTNDRTLEGKPELIDGQWQCVYQSGLDASGLCTGVWGINASTGTWSAQCEERLEAGTNIIHFTVGRAGCVKGFGWPGD